MANDGSQIKAGGVHFEINADAKRLKAGVKASEQELKKFGTGIANAGTKAGTEFSSRLRAGLIGAFSVGILDGPLREIAESLKRGKDESERASFELGQSIATNIRKGLENAFVVGPLGSIVSQALYIGAESPMDTERIVEAAKANFQAANAAYIDIASATAKLKQDQSMSAVAKEIAAATEALAPMVERLKAAGQSSEAIAEATAEYLRIVQAGAVAKHANVLGEALSTIDRMTGSVDAQAQKWMEVEKIAKRVEESYRAIGRGDLAADAGATVRERFRWGEANASHLEKQEKAREAAAEAARETERSSKAISDVVTELEKEASNIGKSGLEQLRDQLVGMGAGSDLVERALQARAALDMADNAMDPARQQSAFGTFLASRIDQITAAEPMRKIEDKVGAIQKDLQRLIREVKGNSGLAFGA